MRSGTNTTDARSPGWALKRRAGAGRRIVARAAKCGQDVTSLQMTGAMMAPLIKVHALPIRPPEIEFDYRPREGEVARHRLRVREIGALPGDDGCMVLHSLRGRPDGTASSRVFHITRISRVVERATQAPIIDFTDWLRRCHTADEERRRQRLERTRGRVPNHARLDDPLAQLYCPECDERIAPRTTLRWLLHTSRYQCQRCRADITIRIDGDNAPAVLEARRQIQVEARDAARIALITAAATKASDSRARDERIAAARMREIAQEEAQSRTTMFVIMAVVAAIIIGLLTAGAHHHR